MAQTFLSVPCRFLLTPGGHGLGEPDCRNRKRRGRERFPSSETDCSDTLERKGPRGPRLSPFSSPPKHRTDVRRNMTSRTSTTRIAGSIFSQLFWAVALALLPHANLLARTKVADPLSQQAQELFSQYRSDLESLATWCDQQHRPALAEKTRSWYHRRNPNKLYVASLPVAVGSLVVEPSADNTSAEYQRRFVRLRKDFADAAFELARKAIRAGRASLAFDLVMAAVRENPDHRGLRRVLGYQPYQGQWRTPYEIARLRNGYVWHDRFGWIARSRIKRYERGERYYDGRWIDAEEDARLHADIRRGWDIETEHFIVRTNSSIQAGVELGVQLEKLYRVWKQLFIGYYASAAHVAALFDARRRSQPVRLPQHTVVFFRSREDYVASLRPLVPQIEITTGYYNFGTRRAYFYASDKQDWPTVFHEATHQLFHAARPVSPNLGKQSNFWIVEGAAMYMESLHEEDGFYVLGGFDTPRMQAARYRLLHDEFYIPLQQFVGMGVAEFQQHDEIAKLYSQAAGLTHFLIHYDSGRYRDAVVTYLREVYSGRDDPGLLARLTGTRYAELDEQYRRFMQSGPGRLP